MPVITLFSVSVLFMPWRISSAIFRQTPIPRRFARSQKPPATAVLLESRQRHLLIAASASHFFAPSDRLNLLKCRPRTGVHVCA